jgi:hypothetical protein
MFVTKRKSKVPPSDIKAAPLGPTIAPVLQRSTEMNAQFITRLDMIDKRQINMEDQMSMLVSVIAINSVLRGNVMIDVDVSDLTRSVMQKMKK